METRGNIGEAHKTITLKLVNEENYGVASSGDPVADPAALTTAATCSSGESRI